MDSLLELFQTIAVLICIYGISKFDLSATYDNISSEVTDNEE